MNHMFRQRERMDIRYQRNTYMIKNIIKHREIEITRVEKRAYGCTYDTKERWLDKKCVSTHLIERKNDSMKQISRWPEHWIQRLIDLCRQYSDRQCPKTLIGSRRAPTNQG